jgi:hypothetical protein
MSRPLVAFVAILCIGALISPLVPVSPFVFWAALLVAGLLAAGAARGRPREGGGLRGQDAFLCDSCKYNDARYCSRVERPNATTCPDYKMRGS